MSRIGAWAGGASLVLCAIGVGGWDAGGAASTTAVDPDGRQLFTAKGCSVCHVGPDSTTEGFGQFPPLDDAADWAGERQPGIAARDYLAQSIVAPGAFVSPVFRRGQTGPAGRMPTLRLTAEEVDSLVTYLLEE